jgi:hypothetical protein
MSELNNVAGTSQTAPNSAAVNAVKTKTSASRYVDGVCVAAENMGVMDTRYGKKHMVKFTFEIEELNEYGSKRRLTRLFHLHTHPMSALSIAAKSWLDRDLADEEEKSGRVDIKSFVDEPACLKVVPGDMYNGKRYENIAEILGRDDDEGVVEEIDDGASVICVPEETQVNE